MQSLRLSSSTRAPLPRATLLLGVALAVDALCGELPSAAHPVVWMGRALARAERVAPHGGPARLLYGGFVAIGLPLLWGLVGAASTRWFPWPVQALLLKSAFAGRALLDASRGVEHALRQDDITFARDGLRALVSRPTETLDAPLVSAAAVESLAENLADSWVAPLCAYVLGGLPAALAYRAVNTADAMWGYRTPCYERLGKASARLDDVLNLLPARLSALFALAVSRHRLRALRAWRCDAHRTASPNAGQTMALVAGALDVRLEKPGYYVLHAHGRLPGPDDVARARALVGRAMLLAGLLALAATYRPNVAAQISHGRRAHDS